MATSGSRTKAKLTKAGIADALVEKGFSVREAKQLTDIVLSAIVAALHRKETVELPFGTLEVRSNPEPYRYVAFGKIAERFRNQYRVVFKPYEA